MQTDDIDDEKLLYIVGMTDKKLFDSGLDIRDRAREVPHEVMKMFGHDTYVMSGRSSPLIFQRIMSTFASIYRPEDLAAGGHIGVFMYRDIFARIRVPILYGLTQLNPFDFVELTPVQLRIIQSEPDEIQRYVDQFIDVSDVQYGISELLHPFSKRELVVRFFGLSRLHLHSAAAILTGGYDYRGAVQAALLATELALKAGAAAQGLSEAEVKNRFWHNNSDIADFIGGHWPEFDIERVNRVLATQPRYVPNRYSAEQPGRREAGHLVMGAQYIASEVVRQMSDRDFRSFFEPPVHRSYPA